MLPYPWQTVQDTYMAIDTKFSRRTLDVYGALECERSG